jgi:hypothetical protein
MKKEMPDFTDFAKAYFGYDDASHQCAFSKREKALIQ